MTSPRLLVGLVLGAFLLQSGCAYSSAMRKASKAGRQDDWALAFERYTEAYSIKATDEARTERESARRNALAQADRMITTAVESGDFAEAAEGWQILKKVAGNNELEIDPLKKAISEGLTSEVARRIEAGDAGAAYDIVLDAQRAFEGEMFVDAALDKVRFHFRGRSEELVAQGRFREADAQLQQIIDREPDRAEILARQRAMLREGWANQLVVEARDNAKNDRPGVAAVQFARAYELLKRNSDLERATEFAEKATWRSSLRVHMKYGSTGSGARRKVFQNAMKNAIEGIENATMVSKDHARLILDADVGEARCSESKATEKVDREYISGQIDVPNEPYVELKTRLDAALADQSAAQAKVDELSGPFREAGQSLRKATEKVDAAKKVDEDATRQLRRAEKNLAEQTALVAKLEDQAAKASDAAQIAELNTKISVIAENVLEWEDEVARWKKSTEESAGAMALAESERGPILDEHKRLKSGFDEANRALESSTQRVNELNADASKTPQTKKQDVVEVFSYDKETWTRTCSTPLYATSWTAWESALDEKQTLKATKEEKDIAHRGHPPSKLEADPKAYVGSEDDLVEEADAENIKTVVEWVTKLASEYYALRVKDARAELGGDPLVSTEEVVSLYVGSPGFLDDETKGAFEAFLAKEHGLEDPTILTGAIKAAPPPPEIDDFL